MTSVALVLGTEILLVDRLLLCQATDLFAYATAPGRYTVTSSVSPTVFRTFVGAIQGEPLEITTATLDELSALCQEFRCPHFLQQLSDFRSSAEYRISCLTERVSALEAQVAAAIAALSGPPAGAAGQALLLPRLSRLEAEVLRVSGGSEADIGRLRADVCALKDWISVHTGSAIGSMWRDFPSVFGEFSGKRFTPLWRGSRDGFGASDFPSRCDGHATTLTLIEDTEGNIFGGFWPVGWPSSSLANFRPSHESFIFTLKNPHNIPARKFALNTGFRGRLLFFSCSCGPYFCDIYVDDHCNANTDSYTGLGYFYANETRLDGTAVLTDSPHFTVKEIEVFEITS
jgi:hypothetical protein